MKEYYELFLRIVSKLKDIPLLAMRLILADSFWKAGVMKWDNMDGTIWWFGSLGIPLPTLNAYMAATTEVAGAILLILGLGTRLISIPLKIVLLVAIATVHAGNGWLAIAESDAPGVAERLGAAKEILKEHGNYEWLTGAGNFVVLNNGVEFTVIYIVMLLMLLSSGAGKFSVDYILSSKK